MVTKRLFPTIYWLLTASRSGASSDTTPAARDFFYPDCSDGKPDSLVSIVEQIIGYFSFTDDDLSA